MSGVRRSMVFVRLFSLVVLAGVGLEGAPSSFAQVRSQGSVSEGDPTGPNLTGTVLSIDFVRTHAGERAAYLRFLEENWARARGAVAEQGYVADYEVIVRERDADDEQAWDVMLVTEYVDADAYARREEIFQSLFEDPAYRLRAIDGKGPRDMARILVGGVEAMRVPTASD